MSKARTISEPYFFNLYLYGTSYLWLNDPHWKSRSHNLGNAETKVAKRLFYRAGLGYLMRHATTFDASITICLRCAHASTFGKRQLYI